MSEVLKLQVKLHDDNTPNINIIYKLNDIITIS